MAETWLKSCVKVPYPNPLSRLDQYSSSVPNGGNPYGNSMQFIVNHVVAGMFSASNQPNDVMRARGNSWPITLFRSGRAEQHFPLEAMAWHAGAKANYRGIGIEWEGGTNHSGPTAAQKAKGIEVEAEIARFRRWANIKKGSTGFEHNDFMSTGCPGFPIPWSALESGTKVQAPVGIWSDVKSVSGEVTLYQDTNLVQLPSMIFVKKLVKGTKLIVKGLWKGSHYLTQYSYDKRISNGFAKSATIAPAPPPPPPPPPPSSFWDDVKQISQSVTLYEDINLVSLPGKTFVKKLVKGTKLSVKGIWNNSYYITVYSYDMRIQNGFAVSATIPPPAPEPTPEPDCSKQEAVIVDLRQEIVNKNNTITTLTKQLKQSDDAVTALTAQVNDLESEASTIKQAIKVLTDYSA